MSKAKARVFVPLTKVDEEQRLVYGTITQEILDKSGEVMDYETSKPLFEEWSNGIHEASGGLSKGNLRVMHGLNVAGKVTDINFDDDAKSIDVCSKVVDDAEWNKVLEGCYTGFSVGGSYAKRWSDNGVKKFTAKPNEVSLVDNPCVPSATFSLVKADGAEEQIEFKVEHDADLWPELAKSADGMKADDKEEAGVTNDDDSDEDDKNKKKPKAKAEKAVTNATVEPTAAQIAEKAGDLAKAANDGTTWQDHIETARSELLKVGATQAVLEQARQEGGKKSEGAEEEEAKEGSADEGAEDSASADEAAGGTVEKTTPPGVKQVWTASDGKTFDKKADAEAHEETLQKAAEPKTDAEQLRDRLNKALTPDADQPVETAGLFEDFDRLSKAVAAISTPFDENGQPKLEKGMYTVNRFSNVLSDMASLSRTIKAESIRENSDAEDATVSAAIIGAVKTLGQSFLDYAKDQVTELLAGMDDDVVVTYYDYYYAAAKDDSDNGLAKDVCSLLEDQRDPSRERRETLSKAFGYVEATLESTDELSPPMQKRFDALESENAELKKVAGEAVEKVEELAKRMQAIEDTPLPRAPKNVIEKGGEGTFLGKAATTEEEKVNVLQEMLKTHGPDALATMMIKASHATGGQKLSLRSE